MLMAVLPGWLGMNDLLSFLRFFGWPDGRGVMMLLFVIAVQIVGDGDVDDGIDDGDV